MSETLKSIIDSYRSGLLSTTNIQVVERKLSNETIKFPSELIADLTLDSSTFKNSDLINIEFINVNFESSCLNKRKHNLRNLLVKHLKSYKIVN